MTTPDAKGGQPTAAGDEFEHPYVAVDVIALSVHDGDLKVSLVERTADTSEPPHGWAVSGAFVQMHESVDDAASRVAVDKIGLAKVPDLIALPAHGEVDRDPRRRVISLPHVALLSSEAFDDREPPESPRTAVARVVIDDAGPVELDGVRRHLVFDHDDMLRAAVAQLRSRIRLDDRSVYEALLPEAFTLRRLQRVHEAIMGDDVNRDSFRRRLQATGWLRDTGEQEENVEHRPARLWRWS